MPKIKTIYEKTKTLIDSWEVKDIISEEGLWEHQEKILDVLCVHKDFFKYTVKHA